jgi:hypothetical protein
MMAINSQKHFRTSYPQSLELKNESIAGNRYNDELDINIETDGDTTPESFSPSSQSFGSKNQWFSQPSSSGMEYQLNLHINTQEKTSVTSS